jgi:catechol 2,3-dioxygenase-like lactoylglutathione lyase family enzyme
MKLVSVPRILPAILSALLGLLALGGCGPMASSTAKDPPPPPIKVEAVLSVGMTVGDMDRSVDFYSRVLSFEKVSDVEVAGTEYERLTGVFGLRMRLVRMRLGEELLDLTEYLAPRGRPVPIDTRSNDRWFQHVAIIVRDMDEAYRHLRKHKVEHASTGPQRLPDWNKKAGGIRAFYFKDPDGHHLEVLQFPKGKGDARWHRKADRLFLGIDHTAVVVADTGASLALYRDRLGLKVAGESENHGTEQEHLSNVFGARLRITTLRAPAGPGIELLEYFTPRDGRPAPPDGKANDLWHWQVRLHAADVDAAAQSLRGGVGRLVSPGAITLSDDQPGYSQAALARDPDGHALLFTAK